MFEKRRARRLLREVRQSRLFLLIVRGCGGWSCWFLRLPLRSKRQVIFEGHLSVYAIGRYEGSERCLVYASVQLCQFVLAVTPTGVIASVHIHTGQRVRCSEVTRTLVSSHILVTGLRS